MKVLGLIEQDLDIVSKEYVDNKVKEVAKADDVAPEGYMKVDLLSLWAVYGLNEGIHNRVSDALGFSKLLQKCITKEKTHLISPDIDVEKQVITPPELLDIVKSNRICYISERDYLEGVCYYFERIRAGVKLNILVPILWAALKGKGEGHTKKEQIYEDIFELLKNFIAGDGKTPIGDLKGYSGEPLSKDEAGLSQLIEENLDIYANPLYLNTEIDNVIDAILSGGSGESKNPNLKGHVGLDLIAFTMFLPSKEQCKAMGITREEFADAFLETAVDSEDKLLSSKYEYTALTIEKLSEIALTDPVVYIEKNIFLTALLSVKDADVSTTENPQLKDYIKVNIPTLYMIFSLIKSSLPKNAHLVATPDDEVLATLSFCVDKDKKEIKTEGKTILELANTVREAYIPKSQFDELITTAITEDFIPVGKKKGYELMKTHYAIYLFTLGYMKNAEREGLHQKFFKLIKNGYSANEYEAGKVLASDFGFTYDESAPESSYSVDALSKFADKHPEIYVPTAFTEYVKGTAGSTADIASVIMTMSQYLEIHKNDPKIKIVTPNEYKINRKDPDTLYIVKES